MLDASSVRERIVAALRAGEGAILSRIEWDKLLIRGSANPDHIGYLICDLAAAAGLDPDVWMLSALGETQGRMQMAVFAFSPDNVEMQMGHPAIMFGADGMGMLFAGSLASIMAHWSSLIRRPSPTSRPIPIHDRALLASSMSF